MPVYQYFGRLLLGTGDNQQRVTTAKSVVHSAAADCEAQLSSGSTAQAELDQLARRVIEQADVVQHHPGPRRLQRARVSPIGVAGQSGNRSPPPHPRWTTQRQGIPRCAHRGDD